MAIPHDSPNSAIEIRTRLSGPRLAEISEYVAETSGSNGAAVYFEGFDGTDPTFSVRGTEPTASDLTFHVEIASRGQVSTGHIEIDHSPVRTGALASCYSAYIRFVQRFGDIVRLEDPAARVMVS